MGAMADAALTVGGDVVGMIPEALRRPASSFRQRKGQLQKQSDVLLSVDIVAVGIEIGRDVAVGTLNSVSRSTNRMPRRWASAADVVVFPAPPGPTS